MSNMDKQPINVVTYVRVSTRGQAEEGYSIDAQQREIEDYCRRNGYNIVEAYVDAGISGTSIKGRFQLKKMLEDISKKP